MYNNPNQPQQPPYAPPPQPPSYGQPPLPPQQYWQPQPQSPPLGQPPQQYRQPQPQSQSQSQSPPLGQPPQQYRQPQHGISPVPNYALPPQQQPKKSRQGAGPLMLIVFIALVVLVAGGIIATVVLIITPPTRTPTPTINRGATTSTTSTTPAPITATTPASAVTNYYDAIKNQDYATAFQYLDAKFVSDSAQPMTQAAFSKLAQGFDTQAGKVTSYSITSTVTDSNAIVIITVHAIRILNGTSQPHDTHLQLKQESSGWKIIGLDNI